MSLFQKVITLKLLEKKHIQDMIISCKLIQTHGLWDGINPFKNCLVEKNKEDKIGIITRGKVRLSKQIDFWLNVPQASNAIKRAKDVEFYKGIGELPFFGSSNI